MGLRYPERPPGGKNASGFLVRPDGGVKDASSRTWGGWNEHPTQALSSSAIADAENAPCMSGFSGVEWFGGSMREPLGEFSTRPASLNAMAFVKAPLFDQTFDSLVGRGARSPNKAVPMRTMVAPSSMATSKSPLMPMLNCGKGAPSRAPASACNSRSF